MLSDIAFDEDRIAAFCKKWEIVEFAFFGSVLREDFRLDSDVDVVITLGPSTQLDLFDWMAMREELEDILERPVDLVEKTGLKNPYRREGILSGRQIVYAA